MSRGYSSWGGRFGGRGYGGYGTTGDYGYGASGHYGESQFGGGAEEDLGEPTVAVREGEVTLDGSVPERCMRYLIEDLAAGHPAVRDVDNRISVRKP